MDILFVYVFFPTDILDTSLYGETEFAWNVSNYRVSMLSADDLIPVWFSKTTFLTNVGVPITYSLHRLQFGPVGFSDERGPKPLQRM